MEFYQDPIYYWVKKWSLANGSFSSSLENFYYLVVLNLLIVGKLLDINHFTIFVLSFLLLEKKFLQQKKFLISIGVQFLP